MSCFAALSLEGQLFDEPAHRALRPVAIEQLGDRLVELADRARQLVAAARRFAKPERNRRRLAVRVRDVDLALLDFLNAIARVAELEHVAGQALEREVLVQRADRQLARQQHDLVVELIGNRAAVRDGRQRGAAPAAQHVVDAVEVQVRAAPPAVRREAVGDHARDSDEVVEREILVARGVRETLVQILDLPFLHADLSHDLLREHVERLRPWAYRVELAAANACEHRRALDEIVARQREQPPFRNSPEPVARPADALQERRDPVRRAELADEIDVADVDAQFERRRRDERLQLTRLQAFLGLEPVLLREAAVMRRHGVLAEPLGQVACRALGVPSRVDEHERRAMRADQLREPVVLFDPDLGRHDRLERRPRQLEREIALTRVAFVDDRARLVSDARQEARQHVDRLRRRRDADARRRLKAQRLEPLERQRQMRAALVAGERVNLVDDGRLDGAQHVPARLRAEQDVQRLRRRDEDVRRLPAHARALRSAACRPYAPRRGSAPRRACGLRTRGRCLREARAGSSRCRSTAPSAVRRRGSAFRP